MQLLTGLQLSSINYVFLEQNFVRLVGMLKILGVFSLAASQQLEISALVVSGCVSCVHFGYH